MIVGILVKESASQIGIDYEWLRYAKEVVGPPQQLPKRKCRRYGHEWIPTIVKPLTCPKCLTYD